MVWTGNYDNLTNFLHNINKQHPTTEFDFLISKETISCLDTKVYIDKDQNIQITVHHKETDCKNYLHSNSEDLLCLKKSISFNQALKLKRICST